MDARVALARVQIPTRRFENFIAQSEWARLRTQTVNLGALGTTDGDGDDGDDDDDDEYDGDDDEVLSHRGLPRSAWTSRARARRGACCAWRSTALAKILHSTSAASTRCASVVSSSGAC